MIIDSKICSYMKKGTKRHTFMDMKLKTDPSQQYRDQQLLQHVRHKYSELTPGGKRILNAIIRAGWKAGVFTPPRRVDIGEVLGRTDDRLTPHDIELLKRLEAAKLIEQRRHALKLVHHMARGAEYRYHISDRILECFKQIWREKNQIKNQKIS